MTTKKKAAKLPQVGDEIYAPSSYYLSHGIDDFVGGLARVKSVRPITELTIGPNAGKHFVTVEEGGSAWRWEGYLDAQQAELKKEFGKRRAHPDPDNSPESNRWD
jgi:hypothetical protein